MRDTGLGGAMSMQRSDLQSQCNRESTTYFVPRLLTHRLDRLGWRRARGNKLRKCERDTTARRPQTALCRQESKPRLAPVLEQEAKGLALQVPRLVPQVPRVVCQSLGAQQRGCLSIWADEGGCLIAPEPRARQARK